MEKQNEQPEKLFHNDVFTMFCHFNQRVVQ